MTRFEQALDTLQGRQIVEADKAEAKALGVTGTPGFFVNGHFLSGAKPFDEFAQVINAELNRMKIPLPPAAAKQKA
jgi:protein-disulfide isomerase